MEVKTVCNLCPGARPARILAIHVRVKAEGRPCGKHAHDSDNLVQKHDQFSDPASNDDSSSRTRNDATPQQWIPAIGVVLKRHNTHHLRGLAILAFTAQRRAMKTPKRRVANLHTFQLLPKLTAGD